MIPSYKLWPNKNKTIGRNCRGFYGKLKYGKRLVIVPLYLSLSFARFALTHVYWGAPQTTLPTLCVLLIKKNSSKKNHIVWVQQRQQRFTTRFSIAARSRRKPSIVVVEKSHCFSSIVHISYLAWQSTLAATEIHKYSTCMSITLSVEAVQLSRC